MRNTAIAATLGTALLGGSLASAHFNDKEPNQSYRQSYFTLVAMNFGPLVAMAKGEMPFDAAMAQGFANDLAGITQLNLKRSFGPGSDKGTTRAKPEIWSNMADFESKLMDLQEAAATLQEVAAGGDAKAIAMQTGAVGKTCKACHDEYKSKDYLY
jgi:cytochrome c556